MPGKDIHLRDKLESILQTSQGERLISEFLSQHPELLRWAVCWTAGHCAYVLKEFPLGSDYRPDFVVLTSYSGRWEVHMIELEPHDDRVITQAGLPSNKLNTALSQIYNWKEYIQKYPNHIRKDLSKWCIKKDLLKIHNDGLVPSNNTGDKLDDPDTFITYHFHVYIGNRVNMNSEQRNKRNQIQNTTDVKISSYSRFLDIAENFDNFNAGQRVMLTKSDD